MLELAHVSFTYPEGKAGFAVNDVSLEVHPDQIVGLTGRSGCGKTTLANLVCGYFRPDRGEIRVGSQTIDGPTQRVAMVFQDDGLWPWLTLSENIDVALKAVPAPVHNTVEMLKEIGLEFAAELYPSQLSGGMKKRGEICRVLALEPRVIVLDEALKSLDYQTRCEVWAMLRRHMLRHPATLVINITHDLLDIAENCTRCIVMVRDAPMSEVDWRPDAELEQKISKIRSSILGAADA